MIFGERLTQLRKENGYTRESFAEYLGISKYTLRNYELAINEPNSNFLRQISDLFNVSMDYLMGSTNEREKILPYNLKTSEYEHIQKYRNLDSYGREAVNAILTIETKRIESNTIIESSREITATDERTVINRMKKSPDYLMNRAAHLNKDATPEQIQQDNDMMDDETIWGD